MPLSADTFIINLYVALASPVIGSGIAAGAARFANGASWDFTPSTCPACGRRLGLLELIPLVSWAAQRGKCRGCSAPISRSYPMIELAAVAVAQAVEELGEDAELNALVRVALKRAAG